MKHHLRGKKKGKSIKRSESILEGRSGKEYGRKGGRNQPQPCWSAKVSSKAAECSPCSVGAQLQGKELGGGGEHHQVGTWAQRG